jgi:hypothetical protein
MSFKVAVTAGDVEEVQNYQTSTGGGKSSKSAKSSPSVKSSAPAKGTCTDPAPRLGNRRKSISDSMLTSMQLASRNLDRRTDESSPKKRREATSAKLDGKAKGARNNVMRGPAGINQAPKGMM